MTTFMYYYLNFFSLENLRNWNSGIEQVFQKMNANKNSRSTIVISDRVADYPYIFYLFFNKISPKEFQSVNKNGGDIKSKYGNYEFRSIDWEKDKLINNTILIGTDEDISIDDERCEVDKSKCAKLGDQIVLPDKQIIYIYENKTK